MLVVITHTQQAQAFLGKRLSQGHGIDRPVDDKHDATGSFRDLLTVGHNDLRHMDVGWVIGHKDSLPGVIMGNHGLRARHDTAQHRDLALVHGAPAPVGNHVTIDIDDRPCLVRYQHRHQGLGGVHALQLSQKLAQRCTLIPMANQRLERMLTAIELAETVDPEQGRKKQRLKAVQNGRRAMMQQGKVIVRVRLLMGFDRLREVSHDRAKGLLVVEPLGKHMYPHTGHMGCDLDHCRTRAHRLRARSVPRAARATIEPPGSTPAVDMAQAHGNHDLPLGGLVEQHPTRALRLFVEQAP